MSHPGSGQVQGNNLLKDTQITQKGNKKVNSN